MRKKFNIEIGNNDKKNEIILKDIEWYKNYDEDE